MKILLCVLVITILSGCSDSDNEAPSTIYSHVGTWNYSGISCNGVNLATSGIAESLTLTETSGTYTATGSGCTITESNFTISRSGNTLLAPNSGTISCTPNPCDLNFTVTGPGGSVSSAISCPDDLPLVASGTTVSINSSAIIVKSDDGAGTVCETTYTKSN
ncbi:MAG: hypothetical protein KDD58_12205 [Bdellovibrionales bacterium]|nr:hypothetical protein [Bdellovibrionales bacterium]